MAGQPCRICSAPIEPGEAVSFNDGELLHMACCSQRSEITPRRTETTYRGFTIRVLSYPLLGRWRADVIVHGPGRRATDLGRMPFRDSSREALAWGWKAATEWIDKQSIGPVIAPPSAHEPQR